MMPRDTETPRNLKVVPPADPPEGNQQGEVFKPTNSFFPLKEQLEQPLLILEII